jgi:hypothetical protein
MFRLHLYAGPMQRETWTDERLDDLSRRMDQGFDRVDRDLRDLRAEIGGVRGELGGVRGEIAEVRALIYRFGAGIIGTIVVATLLHGI